MIGLCYTLWTSTCLLLMVFDVSNCLETYSEGDINQYMEDAIADYQLRLHKASSTMQKRLRRDVSIDDFIERHKSAYMSDIKSIIPWQAIPNTYPVELEPFKIGDDTYLAVVNFKNKDGGYQTNSAVYRMDGNETFQLLQSFPTSGGIDFEFANFGREKYAVFLDHVGPNWYGGADAYTYMKSFQLNQFLPSEDKSRPFQYRTKVRALGARKVKVFTKDNNHYFVTANSFHKRGDKYHVKSTMHVQTAYGYELLQKFETQGAQDVEVEVIDGKRYIFFVNHMDNAGDVDIYSMIYVENRQMQVGKEPFSLYQRIGTHGGRDFEYFTFDGHHYLAVANEYTQVKSMDVNTGKPVIINDYQINSVIYWWTGTMWVQWQLIPTNGAVRWSYFTSSYGHPMLVVANTKSQPVIFTYDPLRGIFKPTTEQALFPFPNRTAVVTDVRSVMPFNVNNETYLAVANYNPTYSNGFNIFKITFEERPVPKLDPTVPEIISSLLDKMAMELSKVEETLVSLLTEVTGNVLTKSTDQNITSDVVMRNATFTGTLSTSEFLYRDKVNNNPMLISENELSSLRKKLHDEEDKLSNIQSRLDDAVLVNKNATITGKKILTDEVYVEGDLTSTVINVDGHIDGTKLEDLRDETWSKTNDQVINGSYTFTKNLTVTESEVHGELNGKRMSSLLTTTTKQEITASKTFTEDLTILNTNLSLINFTINQMNIPNDVVTTKSNQTIHGKKKFNRLILEDLEISGSIDGVDIEDFNKNKMTVTTDQVINSTAIFESGFSSSSDISVGGLVDGVNLTAMENDLNMAGETAVVTGAKTFKSIRINGSLIVNQMNGYNLSDVVTLNTPGVISAKMTFVEAVIITGDIVTNSTVNNLDLSEEVVTTHGNQSIVGHKTFAMHNTSVMGNLDVGGEVDGVDLRKWKEISVSKYTSKAVTGIKIFTGGVEVTDQLNVTKLNSITLSTLKDDLISITGNRTKWTNHVNFETLTVHKNLDVRTLNGFKIPGDFVPLNIEGNITGIKDFTDIINIAGDLSVVGDISGKNFSSFYDHVLKNNTDEYVYSDITFAQALTSNNINVSGTINDLSIPNDVVTTTIDQNITGQLSFTTNTIFLNSIDTHIIYVNRTVNDIDISVMEYDAMHKPQNQTNGSIIFIGGVDCKQNLSVGGLINGINLTELMSTTVRISREQNITGEKRFTEDILFNSELISPGTINSVDIPALDKTALKKGGDQVISNNINIIGNILIKNSIKTVNTTRINDVNFNSFINNAARTDVHNVINGNISYVNGLSVDQLSAVAVDNVNMAGILLNKSNQTLNGNVMFSSLVLNNSIIYGLIDGINIQKLNSDAMTLKKEQNITGKYTFTKDVKVKGNVNVTGLINDINLTEFDKSAVHLSGDEIISGSKHFEKMTIDDVLFLRLLNRANITLLYNDVLLKTGHQRICQKKTFTKSVVTSSNTTLQDIHVTDNVNGINITKLNFTSVKLNGDGKLGGNYFFESALIIDGNLTAENTINARKVNTDFMNTFAEQNITGNKTLTGAEFHGNLNVTGYIDNVNITEMYGSRVSLTRDQILSSNIRFRSVVLKNDVIFPNKSTVNRIDISDSLVGVNEDAVINGHKLFNNTYVDGNLNTTTGMVNGVDVRGLDRDILKLSSPTTQILSSDQRFEKTMTIIGNLHVDGLINGVKVGDVGNYSNDVGNTIKKELVALTSEAGSLCRATNVLLPVAVSDPVLTGVKKVDVFKSFPVDGNLGAIHSTIIADMVFISVARTPGSICGPAYILKCNLEMLCEIHQTIYTNSPTMEFFSYETFDALFVAHWKAGLNDSLGCEENPEIFLYDSYIGQYIPKKSLNRLFESVVAPIINSSTVLAAYLGQSYGEYQRASISSSASSNPFEELPVEVKWFERNNQNYLVVGGYDDNTNFVDILFIESLNFKSLKLKQRIKANGKYISVGKLENGQVIIATAADGPQGSIKLYIFNEKTSKFEFYQRLHRSASTTKLRKIGNKMYLLYASPANGFGLCEWQGVSGYGACATLQTTDTKSVETIITSSGAYTVAGTDKSLTIYKTIFEGNNEPYELDVC